MTNLDGTDRARDAIDVWLGRGPLFAASLLICLFTGLNLYRLARTPGAKDPCEATEVVEGYRSLHGMPVYELAPDGHSTQFYGALVPWVQGQIFRWTGPNNIAGRVLSLVSALVTITMLCLSMRSSGTGWALFIGWAGLLGVNHRSLQYFVANRPDATALLYVTVALLLIGHGQERRRAWSIVLGSACLVVGFFFKQSALVFAAVPLVALLLRGQLPDRRQCVTALVPLAVMGAAIVGLKVLSPTVYHYMIEVPGSYRVSLSAAARYVWVFLAESPLFLLLIGEWIVVDGASMRQDCRVRWLLATLALALPFGAIAYAKYLGAANSLLPALLAMMAFSALRLPLVVARLENRPVARPARLMTGSLLALLLLLTVFPNAGVRSLPPARDNLYWKTVDVVARLPGTVVCPEDTTIPLYAKQYVGRNMAAEMDGHPANGAWPPELPDTIRAEFRDADYVLDVIDYCFLKDCVEDGMLRDLGFTPVEGIPIDPRYYRVYRRSGTDPLSTDRLTAIKRPMRSSLH